MTEPTRVQELNIALARALGVADPSRVMKVVLTIEPRALPSVEVLYVLDGPDGLQKVADRFRLAPQAEQFGQGGTQLAAHGG